MLSLSFNGLLVVGYYLASVQPSSMLVQLQETMYNLMLMELTAQCMEHHGIKCGFIGEVGSSWPLHGESASIPSLLVKTSVSVGCALSSNHSVLNIETPYNILFPHNPVPCF